MRYDGVWHRLCTGAQETRKGTAKSQRRDMVCPAFGQSGLRVREKGETGTRLWLLAAVVVHELRTSSHYEFDLFYSKGKVSQHGLDSLDMAVYLKMA